MSFSDHDAIVLEDFRGLYARFDRRGTPSGFFTECENVAFALGADILSAGISIFPDEVKHGGLTSRPPLQGHFTFNASHVPIRFHLYFRSADTRFITLDSAGNFRDNTSGITILTVAGATDFSGITMYDRFFFSPHDRVTGRAGAFVYVYDPALATTAKKIAGPKPTGTFTIANSATAGNCEPGLHILAIANETDTGFITKPALYASVTSPTPRRCIDLNAIPLGPARTVARWILMSKVQLNNDTNLESAHLYFAKRIADNTTTVLTGANGINLYDSQLASSAEYLKDELEEVPAGIAFCNYGGKLASAAESANPSLIRISKSGEPESFAATDGFITVAKGNGGGLKNIKAAHGILYCFKSTRTFAARDNGLTPSSWPVDVVDHALGAECFSIGEMPDTNESEFRGGLVVGNMSGLYFFNGSYQQELSYNIQSRWNSYADVTLISQTMVLVDPSRNHVYVVLNQPDPITPAEPNAVMLFGDFSQGLDSQSIRWSEWLKNPVLNNFPAASGAGFSTIHMTTGGRTQQPIVVFNFPTSAICYRLDPAKAGEALEAPIANMSYSRYPRFTPYWIPPEADLWHMAGVRFVAWTHGGSLQVSGREGTSSIFIGAMDWTTFNSPTIVPYKTFNCNITREAMMLDVSMALGADEPRGTIISKIIMFVKKVADSRPIG